MTSQSRRYAPIAHEPNWMAKIRYTAIFPDVLNNNEITMTIDGSQRTLVPSWSELWGITNHFSGSTLRRLIQSRRL